MASTTLLKVYMHRILPVIVPRFNRGMAIRPVHRIKHVVDIQNAVIVGGTNSEVLISTVDAPVLANTAEVETGSKVNAIYLKFEAGATSSAALPNFYIAIVKNPGNNLTFPAANLVGADDNKRYVIHQEMVMFQKVSDSNPRTVFNGVIVIPKGYRRFGPNDTLIIRLTSPGVSVNYCIQCHYKEFR